MGIYDNKSRFLNKNNLLNKLSSKNVKATEEAEVLLLSEMIEYISYSAIGKGWKSTKFVDDGEFIKFVDEDGNFNKVVSPKDLLVFHRMNMDISSLLFKYVLFVEQSLNSTLSNIISKNFGTDTSRDEDLKNPNDYLCEEFYGKNASYSLKKIKKHIIKPVKYTSLEHYVNHKNYIPPWIVLNSIYLSDSINLYKIMKSKQKTEIVATLLKIHNSSLEKKEEGEKSETAIQKQKELFLSFFNTIKVYRNKLAHPTVLLKHPLHKELVFKDIGKYSNYTLIRSTTSDTKYRSSIVFSLILSIIPLVNILDISLDFYFDIQLFLEKYKNLEFFEKNIFDLLNIPKNLDDRILQFIFYKYDIPIV